MPPLYVMFTPVTAKKCVTVWLENCRDVCYNVEIDIKMMCIEAGMTMVQLANMPGRTPAYVNRIIRQKETVVAIARSGATDERGGSRRMLLNTVKGE